MQILLTNDDGIYAPGLAAMQRELCRLGEVHVVAPATEQSGVSHSITYLTPLIVKEVFYDERYPGPKRQRWGWSVQGSPADCVKIGVAEFCPQPPELVVSGINNGLNAGINVLYSGTVAAAIEGAFFGITSIAVSLEFAEHAQFDRAARLARAVIEQILAKKAAGPHLYNMNIPTAALAGAAKVCCVPMNVTRYDDSFERRKDPKGRDYYWLTGGPAALRALHRDRPLSFGQGVCQRDAFGLRPQPAVGARGNGDLAIQPAPERQAIRCRASPAATLSFLNQYAKKHFQLLCGGRGDHCDGRLRRARMAEAGRGSPAGGRAPRSAIACGCPGAGHDAD